MHTGKPSELVEALNLFLLERRSDAHRALHHFIHLERQFLLRSDLLDGLALLCETEDDDCLRTSPLARVIPRDHAGHPASQRPEDEPGDDPETAVHIHVIPPVPAPANPTDH